MKSDDSKSAQPQSPINFVNLDEMEYSDSDSGNSTKTDILSKNKSHKKKRIYLPEWENHFKWLKKDNKSGRAFCLVCKQKLGNQTNHLKRHENTKKHKDACQGHTFTHGKDNQMENSSSDSNEDEKSESISKNRTPKIRKYLLEWETQYRWLKKDEESGVAFCIACKRKLSNQKSHLEWHANTQKHKDALAAVTPSKECISARIHCSGDKPEYSDSDSSEDSKSKSFSNNKVSTKKKYNPKWETLYKWLKQDSKSGRAFCLVCNQKLDNQTNHLDRHENTKKHKDACQGYTFTSGKESIKDDQMEYSNSDSNEDEKSESFSKNREPRIRKYLLEWETQYSWLKKDDESGVASCIACKRKLSNHKSHLEWHANTQKHKDALAAVTPSKECISARIHCSGDKPEYSDSDSSEDSKSKSFSNNKVSTKKKYNPKWETLYKWLKKDSKSGRAFCLVCKQKLGNQTNHLQRHENTKKHKDAFQGYTFTSGKDDQMEYSNSDSNDNFSKNRTPKIRKYLLEWETQYSWLKKDDESGVAFCIACKRKLSNQKSHLERHANTKKHQDTLGLGTITPSKEIISGQVDCSNNFIEVDEMEYSDSNSFEDAKSESFSQNPPKIRKYLSEWETQYTNQKQIHANTTQYRDTLAAVTDRKESISPQIHRSNTFIKDDDEDSLPESLLKYRNSKIRRYLSEWETQYSWLKEDSESGVAFCIVCKQRLSNQKHHLERHEKTKKHKDALRTATPSKECTSARIHSSNDFIPDDGIEPSDPNSCEDSKSEGFSKNTNSKMRKYLPEWETQYRWLKKDDESGVAFCIVCKQRLSNQKNHLERHANTTKHMDTMDTVIPSKECISAQIHCPDNQAEYSDSDSSEDSKSKSFSKNTVSTKRKYNPEWEKQYKWLKKNNQNGIASCIVCKQKLGNQRNHLDRHANTQKHKIRISLESRKQGIEELSSDNEMQIKKCFGSTNNNVAIAELKLVLRMIIQNHSFNSLISTLEFNASIYPDSKIANKITFTRPKFARTTQFLGLEGNTILTNQMKASKFCLILNETADISTEKCLIIFARFYDKKLGKTRDNFFRLVQPNTTNESILRTILSALEDNEIPLDNFIGFACDRASVETGIADVLKTRFPHVFYLGSTSTDLISHAAAKTIPSDVEELCRDIYRYFKYSDKDLDDFKALQSLFLVSEQKDGKRVRTRWLSLGPMAKVLREQWVAVLNFFVSQLEETLPKEKENIFKILLSLNGVNLVYLNFLSYMSHVMSKLNAIFKSESSQIVHLVSTTRSTLSKIYRNFLKERYLQNCYFENIKHKVQSPLIRINVLDIYIGHEAETCIKAQNLTKQDVILIKSNILQYYQVICDEIKSITGVNDIKLCMVKHFDPKVISSQCKIDYHSLFESDFGHFASKDKILIGEYKLLEKMVKDNSLQDILEANIEEFWFKVRNLKSYSDTYLFKNLYEYVTNILTLPHSSACAERFFSKLKFQKNKQANKLDVRTCESMLSATNVLEGNELEQWVPNSNLIQRFRASICST